MNDRDLKNLEAYMIALSVGPGRAWSRDFIIAGAWASQVDQLGSAIAHIEGFKDSQAYNQAVSALMGLLVSFRLCAGRDSDYYARQGLDYFYFGICPSCGGTGVTKDQHSCENCFGVGHIPSTELNKKCLLMIKSACDAFDAGIGPYLRGNKMAEHHEPIRSFNPLVSEYGTVTPPHPTHA